MSLAKMGDDRMVSWCLSPKQQTSFTNALPLVPPSYNIFSVWSEVIIIIFQVVKVHKSGQMPDAFNFCKHRSALACGCAWPGIAHCACWGDLASKHHQQRALAPQPRSSHDFCLLFGWREMTCEKTATRDLHSRRGRTTRRISFFMHDWTYSLPLF